MDLLPWEQKLTYGAQPVINYILIKHFLEYLDAIFMLFDICFLILVPHLKD